MILIVEINILINQGMYCLQRTRFFKRTGATDRCRALMLAPMGKQLSSEALQAHPQTC